MLKSLKNAHMRPVSPAKTALELRFDGPILCNKSFLTITIFGVSSVNARRK